MVAMAHELGHGDTWLANQLRTAGLADRIQPRGRRPAPDQPGSTPAAVYERTCSAPRHTASP
jgi:hypothetical protein